MRVVLDDSGRTELCGLLCTLHFYPKPYKPYDPKPCTFVKLAVGPREDLGHLDRCGLEPQTLNPSNRNSSQPSLLSHKTTPIIRRWRSLTLSQLLWLQSQQRLVFQQHCRLLTRIQRRPLFPRLRKKGPPFSSQVLHLAQGEPNTLDMTETLNPKP